METAACKDDFCKYGSGKDGSTEDISIEERSDKISQRSKEYENVALRRDPAYDRVDEFISILIQFIRDHGLIIYGGLAIDYALRLFGDKIYPDDLLQVDYDFFSPSNVEHAYDIADAFYKLATSTTEHDADLAEGIRAIGALHVKTMRVDIGDNHFIADLTYCPESIFSKLPTLEYQGIKIIHPDMQRIDIHSSLSFPYDYAPFEVIFNRWKKDITRFNLLDKYYPIKTDKSGGGNKVSNQVSNKVSNQVDTKISRVTIGNNMRKYVLNGFAAYGAMYTAVSNRYKSVPSDIIEGVFDVAESTITIVGNELEIVHFNIAKCAEEIGLAHVHSYRPYFNLMPELLTGSYNGPSGATNVTIQSTQGRLLSTVSVVVNDSTYRLVCAQYLLKYFLSTYYRLKMDPNFRAGFSAEVFLSYYVSTMKLIQFEDAQRNMTGTETGTETAKTITGLSITTYGSDNVSLSKVISVTRILADMKEAEMPYLPSNYYPKNIFGDRKRPQFDYTRNHIYLESGEEIVEATIEETTKENAEETKE